MTPRVRPARPDDAEAIGNVRMAAWRAAYGHLLPSDFFERFDRAASVARWRAQIVTGRRLALVALGFGGVIGFCSYGPCRDDDLAHAGEVYALYVHPQHWSTGAGRTLLHAAIATFDRHPVVLWVLRDNPRARRFYEIAGLRPDGSSRLHDLNGTPLPEVRYRLDD